MFEILLLAIIAIILLGINDKLASLVEHFECGDDDDDIDGGTPEPLNPDGTKA